MECVALLAGGGEVHVQLLYALSVTSTLPAGEPPVKILSQEEVTQGDPLSMFLYGITLIPLAKEFKVADPGILSPFYANDSAFDGSAQQSAQLLKLLTKRGTGRGYFTEPA